jgi:Ni,Fe-hydrogenase I large subunit
MRPRFRLHVFEESATSFGFKKLASTLPVHKGIHSFDFCGTATAHMSERSGMVRAFGPG